MMLSTSDDSGHLCFVPDLRRETYNFSFFSVILTVDLLYVAFIMLKYIPSIPNLLIFYHEKMFHQMPFLHLLDSLMIV